MKSVLNCKILVINVPVSHVCKCLQLLDNPSVPWFLGKGSSILVGIGDTPDLIKGLGCNEKAMICDMGQSKC